MVVPNSARPAAATRRLLAVTAVLLALLGGWTMVGSASTGLSNAAGPKAKCGPGPVRETSPRGRVPAADYANGRAAKGYRCNAVQVGHQGSSGGFKTLRYTD